MLPVCARRMAKIAATIRNLIEVIRLRGISRSPKRPSAEATGRHTHAHTHTHTSAVKEGAFSRVYTFTAVRSVHWLSMAQDVSWIK